MRIFKQMMTVSLIAAMSLGLVACGSKETTDDKKSESKGEQNVEDEAGGKSTVEMLLDEIAEADYDNLTFDMELVIDVEMDLYQSLLDAGFTEEELEAESIEKEDLYIKNTKIDLTYSWDSLDLHAHVLPNNGWSLGCTGYSALQMSIYGLGNLSVVSTFPSIIWCGAKKQG